MHNGDPNPEQRNQATSSGHNPRTEPTEPNDAKSNGELQRESTQDGRRPKQSYRYNDSKYSSSGGTKYSSSQYPTGSQWRWFQSSGPDVAPLQATNRELEAQVKQLHIALESTKKQLGGELMEKEAELAEMKKTLCMYNDCSEVELGNMADDINKKIRGLARSVAVKWVKDASKVWEEGGDKKLVSDDEVKVMKPIIGTQLLKALRDAKPGQSKCAPLLLQYAWQACIVAVTAKILRSFSARLAASPDGSVVDNALRKISNAVMKEEVQPAYGRWRFITHRHLKGIIPSEEQAVQTYAGEALGTCLIASRLILKNCCPDGQAFANAFQVQLKEIIVDAFKLLTNIQEKMVTTNYEPYIPPYGTPFQDATMDVDKQDVRYPNDVVVCTTGIGLLFSRKNGRENTDEIPKKYIFRKPQVLTGQNLNETIVI